MITAAAMSHGLSIVAIYPPGITPLAAIHMGIDAQPAACVNQTCCQTFLANRTSLSVFIAVSNPIKVPLSSVMSEVCIGSLLHVATDSEEASYNSYLSGA